MTDQVPPKSEGWWSKQSGGAKIAMGIAGVCCLGILILIVGGGLFAPDANTDYNTTDSADSNVSTDSSSSTTSEPAETESQYKSSCKTISFKQLEKNPEAYAGERIKVSGRVVQIMEGSGMSEIRIDVNDNFGDTVYVTYPGTTSAVEDSYITVYGEVYGSYSYESQAGWEITLPRIDAQYITVGK